ncbi:MAG: hypothetical protein AAB388_04100 [Patescibacteria group bacterium]
MPEEFSLDGKTLEQEASKALSRAENRLNIKDPFVELETRLDRALEESGKITAKDIPVRDIRRTIEEVMADEIQDSKDLADLAVALHELAKQQGSDIANLETMHPDARKIIDDADVEGKNAQTAVTAATADLKVAESKQGRFLFFAWGKGAVDEAAGALSAAKNKLASAEQAIKDAPAKADRRQREILQNATMEESSTAIRAMHERANTVLRERVEMATKSLERRKTVLAATSKRHKMAVDEHAQAQIDFQKQEAQVTRLQAQMDEGALERNTPAYTELQQQIDDAREKKGQLKAKMDAAMGEAQELEEKMQTLIMQRDGLTTLRGNYERSVRIGTAAAKLNREITAIRVELIKGLSDLNVQNELNSVSRQDSIDAARGAADVYNAVERARITYGKQHPAVMRAQREIALKLDSELRYIEQEDAQMIKDWRDRFFAKSGGSPTDGSGSSASIKEFSL